MIKGDLDEEKSIVAMLLMAAFALTACGGGGGAATSEQGSAPAQTSNNKTLIVGFDQSFPPMGFKDSKGEFTGFDLELAKLTAEKMGYDISLQPIDWDSKDAELDTGNINCIWNGFTMTGREDKYTFSKPYMQNRQILVVKKIRTLPPWQTSRGKPLNCSKGPQRKMR